MNAPLVVLTLDDLRRVIREELARLQTRDAGDDLLSIPEASKLTGRGKRTLRDDIRAGRIPGLRVGRSLRVRRSDLLAFVESMTRRPVVVAVDDLDRIAAARGLRGVS